LNATSHGLGLHICQQIAKGLNGSLVFYSKPGEGTKFTLSFKTTKHRKNDEKNDDLKVS